MGAYGLHEHGDRPEIPGGVFHGAAWACERHPVALHVQRAAFSIINPAEFLESFIQWIVDMTRAKGKHIAIDGKAVRAACEKVYNNLVLCVSTDYAIKKELVTILPDDAQKALLGWKGGFSSVRQARDYAICMLAFRLMLNENFA